ncbi:hypothetical protein Scep_011162 [Stephania cephalantha]|uniref:Uncharacterized protein n=1 Tax=Stephania cephalantha TaxID=152367 RepID=A0AAP0P669_9MAGN
MSVLSCAASAYPARRSSLRGARASSANACSSSRVSAYVDGHRGVDRPFVAEVSKAVDALHSEFRAVDDLVAYNTTRVLNAFQNARVGSHHFAGCTGYGHDEAGGREALDKAFAEIFGAESAVVRAQTDIMYQLLAVAGAPYDTLEEVIGIRDSNGLGSLKDFGVTYREVPLASDGGLDWAEVGVAVRPQTKCALIQRSCGYSWRKSLSVNEIGKAIKMIKGADLIAGSLIKNPGGTIAPCGGYVAGKEKWVAAAAARLSAPGLGVDCGSTPGDIMRTFFQGLFLSPQMVGEAIKGSFLIAEVMASKGYKVQPLPRAPRNDTVQAVQLGSRELLLAFCEAVQRSCPVGSFIKPVAGLSPGYASEVIFADGTFIDGSTSELSCDGPLREPFSVFCQGGTHWTHWGLALGEVLKSI